MRLPLFRVCFSLSCCLPNGCTSPLWSLFRQLSARSLLRAVLIPYALGGHVNASACSGIYRFLLCKSVQHGDGRWFSAAFILADRRHFVCFPRCRYGAASPVFPVDGAGLEPATNGLRWPPSIQLSLSTRPLPGSLRLPRSVILSSRAISRLCP